MTPLQLTNLTRLAKIKLNSPGNARSTTPDSKMMVLSVKSKKELGPIFQSLACKLTITVSFGELIADWKASVALVGLKPKDEAKTEDAETSNPTSKNAAT